MGLENILKKCMKGLAYTLIGAVAYFGTGCINDNDDIDPPPPNNPPTLEAIADQIADENTLVQIQASATDADGDTLTYSAQNRPDGASFDPATRIFSWTPSYLQSGNYTVTFAVADDRGGSDFQNVTITVNNVNRPPVIEAISDIVVDEGDLVDLSPVASDLDGDPITFTYETPLDANGDWQTGYTDSGGYVIGVTASDGNGGEDNINVNITVNNISDPPVLDYISDVIADEPALIIVPLSATDVDFDPLEFSLQNAPAGMEINPSTDEIEWQTTHYDADVYVVRVIVSDGYSTDFQDVTFTVNDVNGPPVLANLDDIVANEKDAITANPSATDPDLDTLSYRLENAPAGMSINASTGQIDWQPTYADASTYVIRVIAEDGNGHEDFQDVTIIVNNTPCYRIAFGYNNEIYVANEDGSNRVQLTSNTSYDGHPTWSPDNSQLGFVSDRDSNNEIYTMDSNGANQTRRTNNAADDTEPDWSPDGTQFAFSTNRDGNYQVYTMGIDGSSQTRTASSSPPYDHVRPDWSSSGNYIAFEESIVTESYINLMNPDGTGQTRLTICDTAWSPAWSPDETKIALNNGSSTCVMNSNGTNLIWLRNFAYYPAWKPDGSAIAYYSVTDGAIYLMDPDGSNVRKIIDNASDDPPAWSPVKQ